MLVPIIMGSKSDLEQGGAVANTLQKLGIPSELRVGSAHKTPNHVLEMIAAYEADPRPKVYVTIAGRSNALSAFVDAQVQSPVIACPPTSSAFGGGDIFSSLRMPSGVAPAVVLDPSGAALLVAKILSVAYPELRERIAAFQQANMDTILQDDAELRRKQETREK
ncbi:MAG: 5-(carboxyamino)imidazole ribonucleotide mutase [Chloroflexi bacterium]|nr:5-(carboxyamino)imidazole ribonucleotide mutase [Chloroflexota bacterium]